VKSVLAIGLTIMVVGCGDKTEKPTPADVPTVPVDTPADTPPADDGWEETKDVEGAEEAIPCAPCVPSSASAQHTMDDATLVQDPTRTRNNPLKGFMTSYLWGQPANDFPDQMEFLYLPMADLWGPDGETFSTGLEPLLAAAAARGHHAVLRVYLDYPSKPSGMPAHLSGIVPCQTYTDHGGGCSPDYDDPLLVDAMLGLIAALGAQYDGDPRIGVVQVGLLGFWGEWHTYPHTDWFPSVATQTAILESFDTAFQTTLLQVRRPAANSLDLRMGFHDDSFAYSTMGDIGWFFLPSLIAAGGGERWKEVMIGGELRPELQSLCFQDDYTLDIYAQDVATCIEATHASYLLNYKAFNEEGKGYEGTERERAEQAALQMGYQLELQSASLNLWGLDAGTVEAEVTIELAQTGVAPFYYPLNASLHADGELATNAEDLKTLLPGQSKALTFSLGRIAVSVVTSPMTLRLSSPILLPDQRVLLATSTPGTDTDEETKLSWSVGCTVEGQTIGLGEVSGAVAPGCECLCDVDGLLRACDGSLCESGTEPTP